MCQYNLKSYFFLDLPQVLQKAQMGKMMIWGVELKVDNLYVWRWISRDKEHNGCWCIGMLLLL